MRFKLEARMQLLAFIIEHSIDALKRACMILRVIQLEPRTHLPMQVIEHSVDNCRQALNSQQ